MEESNPYAPPQAGALVQVSEAETTRRKFIHHESSIKTLGCLYLLAGILIIPGMVLSLSESFKAGASAASLMWQFFFIVIGLVDVAIGIGLRRLQKWASLTAITLGLLLSLIYLFDLPGSAVGLVIQGAIILTMLSARTRMVVSADYQRVIAETPQVKLRTSAALWALLVLLLLSYAAAIYSAYTHTSR